MKEKLRMRMVQIGIVQIRTVRIPFILFSIFILSACSRSPDGLSTITIKAPSNQIGTFATIPAGRVTCYAVSVKGTGISGTPSSTCKPESGAVFGFVGEGAAIQGQVAKGKNRTFDIYMYLQAAGENIPCNTLGGFSSVRADRLYLIGTATNINLEKETETVTITTTFPGEAQNLYTVNSYPGSCLPTATSTAAGYQVTTAAGVATGAGYILHGRVGRPNTGETLTGSGIILKVK